MLLPLIHFPFNFNYPANFTDYFAIPNFMHPATPTINLITIISFINILIIVQFILM